VSFDCPQAVGPGALQSDAQKISLNLDEGMLREVEDWRRRQPRIPTLSAAVRELVRIGLDAAKADAVMEARA
jgi:hypothetical protein